MATIQTGVLTYAAVHGYLRRQKGRACEYTCTDCGGPAKQWAYNHSGISEVKGVHCASRVTYSTDLDQYVPLCIRCHVNRDKHGAQGWAA